jgi:predicted nucleic acid-binding Zn ribbon protein
MTRRGERCLRCGGPVAWDASVCRRCNPAGLPGPSRTQYHATVFLAIFLPLLVIGVWMMARG